MIKIINFFKKYNIDIENDNILYIKNVKIPNFYKIYKNNNVLQWEFCHLLYKIYSQYFINNSIFYENHMYKITEKDIVFDCGANMGLFSAYAAAQGAQVYSFEPMSFTRKMLEETAKLYPDNIHIIPFALNDKAEILTFAQCDNPGASHNIIYNINLSNKILYKEKVQSCLLDDFVEQNNIIPTFIKIDVEGSEQKLLIGAKEVLKKYKPILSLSLYHFNEDYKKIPFFIKKNNNLYKLLFFNENGLYLFAY